MLFIVLQCYIVLIFILLQYQNETLIGSLQARGTQTIPFLPEFPYKLWEIKAAFEDDYLVAIQLCFKQLVNGGYNNDNEVCGFFLHYWNFFKEINN